MKAVQCVAKGKVEFVEAPIPELKPGHALIRCHKLSLCGSDIMMIDHYAPDAYPLPAWYHRT